jgi:hypothetical protein
MRLFDAKMEDLMQYYIINQGIKDLLISNTKLNTKDYNEMRFSCAEYIWENIPVHIKKYIDHYMEESQISNLILIKIDKYLTEVYSFSDEYAEEVTQEELLTFKDNEKLEDEDELL